MIGKTLYRHDPELRPFVHLTYNNSMTFSTLSCFMDDTTHLFTTFSCTLCLCGALQWTTLLIPIECPSCLQRFVVPRSCISPVEIRHLQELENRTRTTRLAYSVATALASSFAHYVLVDAGVVFGQHPNSDNDDLN